LHDRVLGAQFGGYMVCLGNDRFCATVPVVVSDLLFFLPQCFLSIQVEITQQAGFQRGDVDRVVTGLANDNLGICQIGLCQSAFAAQAALAEGAPIRATSMVRVAESMWRRDLGFLLRKFPRYELLALALNFRR
jgi:hypothetical protein